MYSRSVGNMRRVLYAVAMDPDRFASFEEQILMLTRRCKERNDLLLPLFICSHIKGNPPIYEDAGLHAECLDLHHFTIPTLLRLMQIIRKNNIEIIHWHFTQHFTNPYLWALTLVLPSVSHFYTYHFGGSTNSPGALVRQIKKQLFKRYERVFGVCTFGADSLRIQGCPENLSVQLNFINADRFKPDHAARAATRKELGAEGHFIVLVVAYLIRQKGVDIVIKALASLPDNIKLWIVGRGEESDRLKELCEELKVAERVTFFGYQQNIQRFTQAADCFVCPSRGIDAAPMVVLEAQSSALPVIGSRVGGIPELISDTTSGFIFRPDDDAQLAEQLRFLYDNPSRHHSMQIEARKWVVDNFSCETQVDRYLSIYAR